MKKIYFYKLVLFLIILTAICIFPKNIFADYIIGNGINIRSGPGTNYSIVTTISRNDKELKVVEKSGDWSKIILPDGRTGYIKSSFLRQRSYMKTTGTLNIRTYPSTSNSPILTTLSKGDVVAIIRYTIRETADTTSSHYGWYEVYDLKTGIKGYAYEAYLSYLMPKRICYNGVALRTNPGLGYTIQKYLYNGDNIYLVESYSSGWSKVVSNGVVGYIKTNTFKNGGESVYITTLKDHEGRTNNVIKAAGLINGKVIYSGNCFNYLSYLGQVTAAGGYYNAPEIINGVTVQNENTYGGGICQVSSTLYCALRQFKNNGLVSILERRPHSTKAKYVPYDWDAMVSYNTNLDFKFKANINLKISTEIIHTPEKRLAVKVTTF